MNRKRWTPKEVVTEADLHSREKKKWQLALRRYVLEQHPSPLYAHYFGLPIERFRQWIEIQFTAGLHWENFGSAWQLEHVVPLACFDFSVEADLLLCWNFTNIRVEPFDKTAHKAKQVNVLSAQTYFSELYQSTGLDQCKRMLEKLDRLQSLTKGAIAGQQTFIQEHLADIMTMATLTTDDFNQLNTGMKLADVLLQREILNRFGS